MQKHLEELGRCLTEQIRCSDHVAAGLPDGTGAMRGLEDWLMEELLVTDERQRQYESLSREQLVAELGRRDAALASLWAERNLYANIVKQIEGKVNTALAAIQARKAAQ